VKIIGHVLSSLIWKISQIIFYILFLVANAYVFNQSHGDWLLFNALHVAIPMALKLRKKLEWHLLWLI
jgi:hypothetical protein